jgi:hypothetical protein
MSKYSDIFFSESKQSEDSVGEVHHAIEKEIVNSYEGIANMLFSEDKNGIDAYENLRGIPPDKIKKLHLSIIRRWWNYYYKKISDILDEVKIKLQEELIKKTAIEEEYNFNTRLEENINRIRKEETPAKIAMTLNKEITEINNFIALKVEEKLTLAFDLMKISDKKNADPVDPLYQSITEKLAKVSNELAILETKHKELLNIDLAAYIEIQIGTRIEACKMQLNKGRELAKAVVRANNIANIDREQRPLENLKADKYALKKSPVISKLKRMLTKIKDIAKDIPKFKNKHADISAVKNSVTQAFLSLYKNLNNRLQLTKEQNDLLIECNIDSEEKKLELAQDLLKYLQTKDQRKVINRNIRDIRIKTCVGKLVNNKSIESLNQIVDSIKQKHFGVLNITGTDVGVDRSILALIKDELLHGAVKIDRLHGEEFLPAISFVQEINDVLKKPILGTLEKDTMKEKIVIYDEPEFDT